MTSESDHARSVQEQIRQILLHDWDPIGVQGAPSAQDEYDSYVGGVYTLLAKGSSARQVAAHLARIEADSMGLSGAIEPLLPIASKLCSLDVHLKF